MLHTAKLQWKQFLETYCHDVRCCPCLCQETRHFERRNKPIDKILRQPCIPLQVCIIGANLDYHLVAEHDEVDREQVGRSFEWISCSDRGSLFAEHVNRSIHLARIIGVT